MHTEKSTFVQKSRKRDEKEFLNYLKKKSNGRKKMKFYNPSFLNKCPSEKRKSLDKNLHHWSSDFWGSYQVTKKNRKFRGGPQ